MIAGDLSDLLIRSTVLLSMAWIAALAIERSGGSAAMRYSAWLLGFAGLLLLPLLAAVLPALPLPILPAETPMPIEPATGGSDAAGAAMAEGWPISSVLELAYACVAAALLARLVAGRFLLAGLWKRARPIDEGEPLQLLAGLAESLHLRRVVELRIADRAVVPMTWGTFRPKILVPADAVGWSSDQWHTVLLHELGHVARRDSAGRALAAALCAIYWLNPAVWLAAECMRREQEHACDDLVLSQGAEAGLYARNLLFAARNQHGSASFSRLAAAIVGRSDLERRLTAIVSNIPRRRAGGAFVTVGSLLAFAIATAAAAIVPVAAEAPEPPNTPSLVTREKPSPLVAPAPVAALRPAPAPSAPARAARAAPPTGAPITVLAQAAAPVASTPAEQYETALARYREEKARYLADREIYRAKLADYRRAMEQHRRDKAEYRRKVEAIRALPHDDPNRLFPPAPTAPVAPVAPTAPTVPPVPHDYHPA